MPLNVFTCVMSIVFFSISIQYSCDCHLTWQLKATYLLTYLPTYLLTISLQHWLIADMRARRLRSVRRAPARRTPSLGRLNRYTVTAINVAHQNLTSIDVNRAIWTTYTIMICTKRLEQQVCIIFTTRNCKCSFWAAWLLFVPSLAN